MDDNATLVGVVIIALIVVGLLLSRREQHKTYPEQRETCPDCGEKLTEACFSCGGTGKISCTVCQGSGQRQKIHICRRRLGGFGFVSTSDFCPDCGAKLTEACSFCHGTGKHTCMMCRGNGRIKKVHICQKQRDAWRL